MPEVEFTEIADHCVIHIWKKADDDDCGEGPDTVEVGPDFYQQGGVPICQCGQDMVYHHTEVMSSILTDEL